jgi:hypothetical protein
MEIERLVGTLDGVRSVTCDHDLGTQWHTGLMSPAASGRLAAGRRELELCTVAGPTVHHTGAKETRGQKRKSGSLLRGEAHAEEPSGLGFGAAPTFESGDDLSAEGLGNHSGSLATTRRCCGSACSPAHTSSSWPY